MLSLSIAALLVPLYSGPNSDPKDWKTLENYSHRIPMAVIANPNNGPGNHIYRDYLRPIKRIQRGRSIVLGYIPTREGNENVKKAIEEARKYIKEYHTKGIFLDEMPSRYTQKRFRFYQKLTQRIKKMDHKIVIFGNPGTNFSQRYMRLPINTFIDEEDIEKAVNANPQSSWVNRYPRNRFGEISLQSKNDPQEVRFLLSHRHLRWVYSTETNLNAYGGNPYAVLPRDFPGEIAMIRYLDKRH